jgi:hypothetical protein
MAIARKPEEERNGFDAHRLEMIRLMEEIDARVGAVGKPTMSARELRASQLARGIRPEDNIGSRELLRMRYGDDWDKE